MSTVSINMRDMLAAGIHFGHLTRFRNPIMNPYIYGVQNKVSIINLEKTLVLFREAAKFVQNIASKNGKVLFVGTKRAAQPIIAEYATLCGMPYVDHRWLGGMLTNYKTIKQSIRRLRDLEASSQDGSLKLLTKKEGLTIMRELAKLQKSLGGIKEMPGLPDAIFVMDVGHEKIAIQEANHLKIPVIGVVDTNNSPAGITYPIPGNDDAKRAIEYFVKTFSDIIIEAKNVSKGALVAKYQEEFVDLPESDTGTGEI